MSLLASFGRLSAAGAFAGLLLLAPSFASARMMEAGPPHGFYTGFAFGNGSTESFTCAVSSALSDYDIIDNRIESSGDIAAQIGSTIGVDTTVLVNTGAGGSLSLPDQVGIDTFQPGLNRATENAFPAVRTTCDNKSTTWKVFLGYNWSRSLAFEVSWANFGEVSARTSGIGSFRNIRISDGYVDPADADEIDDIFFANTYAPRSVISARRKLTRPGSPAINDPGDTANAEADDVDGLAYNEIGTQDWYDVPGLTNDGQVRLTTELFVDRTSIGFSGLYRYPLGSWFSSDPLFSKSIIPFLRVGAHLWDVDAKVVGEIEFLTPADVAVCTGQPDDVNCDNTNRRDDTIPQGARGRGVIGTFTDDGVDLLLGVGADFYLSDTTTIRFGFERYFASGDVSGQVAQVLNSPAPDRDFEGDDNTAGITRGSTGFDADVDLWEVTLVYDF